MHEGTIGIVGPVPNGTVCFTQKYVPLIGQFNERAHLEEET